MERQPIERDLNEKGSDVNLSTFSNQNDAHSNTAQNSKVFHTVRQAEEQTTANDHQHPYCQLQGMLGDVLVMLHMGANQSSKPRCIETVKTAASYIKRIRTLYRALFKAGAADPEYPRTPCEVIEIKGCIRGVLKEAGERLTLNKSLTQYLSLLGIKEILKDIQRLLAPFGRRSSVQGKGKW
jgi:hypothetical protein